MRNIWMERRVYKNGLINWKNIVFTLGTILILNITMKAQNIETGKRLLEMEQWNKANQHFITLVKNNESNAVCQFYLGESFLILGKSDYAENHFR